MGGGGRGGWGVGVVEKNPEKRNREEKVAAASRKRQPTESFTL